jgi:hypothetical protein
MSEKNEMRLNDEANESVKDAKLEAALHAALRTEMPSEGFAERVEARIAAGKKNTMRAGVLSAGKSGSVTPIIGRGSAGSSARAHLAKAAVLLLAVTVPLGWRLHHQAEIARGEAAKEQVLLAFRITGSQLRSIQERTQSINAGGMPGGDSQ